MSDTQPETVDIVQHIVNAWDCCGTCAGGVLAEHVRTAVQQAEQRGAARAWDEGHRACYLFERGETHPEPSNPYRADRIESEQP